MKLSGAAGGPPTGSELRFTTGSMSWVEDTGKALAIVKRSAPLDSDVTVDYATSNGSATAPEDYQATSGTLTFYAHEAALPILVPIVADNLAEANETFTLSLSNPSAGAFLGSPSQVIITIEDDDGLVRTLNIRDAVWPEGPNWKAIHDMEWLTLSATSGIGPSTITATADPQGLAPGTYSGTIIVTGPRWRESSGWSARWPSRA